MAENNNTKFIPSYEDYYDKKLYDTIYEFATESLKSGLTVNDLKHVVFSSRTTSDRRRRRRKFSSNDVHLRYRKEHEAALSLPQLFTYWKHHLLCILGVIALGVAWQYFQPLDFIYGSKCLLENNFFLMEISRPVSNCSICRNVKGPVVLNNASRNTYSRYAYSKLPVLVKGATNSWTASQVFSFDFFKKIYEEVKGAYESVEEECQFFPFKSDFVTLRDVFAMSNERAKGVGPEKPWYVGWSNCHPVVASILRKHYSRPHFLPKDSESSAIDWIFMGWPGLGASIHLDYVHRPSWQAQISGEKMWRLFPPPECEDICSSFNISVQKGDIVLIDTNWWYHDTYIDHGELSITIGSEYD